MIKIGTNEHPIILRVQTQKRAEELALLCEKNGWKFIIGVEADKPEDISDLHKAMNPSQPIQVSPKIGRNDPCPCGSGKKFKNCCIDKRNEPIPDQSNIDTVQEPRCGLCGKTSNLTKTPCCDQWICDDEHKYVPFSYARNSCFRNHRRYTLCGYHFAHGHKGKWQDCPTCRKKLGTEMYVYYGTNEYNFEKLQNPPQFTPKRCKKCGAIIRMGVDTFSGRGEDYWCMNCTEFPI